MQSTEQHEHATSSTLFVVPPPPAAPAPVTTPEVLRCRVQREQLVPILALLQSVAEKRSTLPILTHVYIASHGSGYVELRATDLEIGLRCRCPATVTSTGSSTVEARRLYDIVRALPAGEVELTSSTTDGVVTDLTLRCSKSRFRLMSLDPREFPRLSMPDADMATFALPVTTLRTMIDHTLFSAVTDESRPNLNGVLWARQAPDLLRLVASDGHRLALSERAIPGVPTTLASLLFPAKGMTEARKLLDGTTEEMVTVGVSASIATLTIGDTTLTLRLAVVDFPDYHAILALPHPHQLSAGRTDLLAAVRRLLVFTTERARGVTLTIRPGVLELSVATGDIGEGTEEIPIIYNGPSITIGFNARYLLGFLVAVEPAEHVIFELNEPTTPALLRTESDTGYRYVVMPMRVF